MNTDYISILYIYLKYALYHPIEYTLYFTFLYILSIQKIYLLRFTYIEITVMVLVGYACE